MASVQETSFTGAEPIPMAPGLLTPLPWPDWTARIRFLDVDGVHVDHLDIGPYEMDVPPLRDRTDAPVQMMLVVVLRGTSVGDVDGQTLTLSPKQAAIIDGRVEMRFRALEPVRAVRMFVHADHLSERALRCPSLPIARLKHTPLVTGCVGLITGLLQVGSPVVDVTDEEAVGAPLIALLESLLDQTLHADPSAHGPSGPIERRTRIEAHIDRNLDDRGLSAGSIAAALGVSVRTVHAAFDGSGETVAARIRARRLTRAQTLIAVRPEPPNVGAVAARVGLGRDQLTRLFQAATGLTARQWWQQHPQP